MPKPTSRKAAQFTESVIREMTRVCKEHNGVNLAQGFPDFAAPNFIKDAAKAAIDRDQNQYAVTWGSPRFRAAIAEKHEVDCGRPTDPEKEITVCCGATEAMMSALLAIVDPGDEVIIFEPLYENYGPDTILCGAKPRHVVLRGDNWEWDSRELAGSFNDKTKAVILNTPNNPCGKVFSRAELEELAALCRKWDAYVVTDEIYEHIVYDGGEHHYVEMLDGMLERTIFISGLSKTFAVTGWRLGYCIAPFEVTQAIRKVHDFLTVGAAAPLQEAGAVACRIGRDYYAQIATEYQARRDRLLPALEACGYKFVYPKGAYYVLCDIGAHPHTDDVSYAMDLVREAGVATVPGSSFYSDPRDGQHQIRFCFCKKDETLDDAAARLKRFHGGT